MGFNIAHLQAKEQPCDVEHPSDTRVIRGLARGKQKDDSTKSIREVKE